MTTLPLREPAFLELTHCRDLIDKRPFHHRRWQRIPDGNALPRRDNTAIGVDRNRAFRYALTLPPVSRSTIGNFVIATPLLAILAGSSTSTAGVVSLLEISWQRQLGVLAAYRFQSLEVNVIAVSHCCVIG